MARMRKATRRCAACQAVCPGRLHHFWECPVAEAVRGQVAAGLGAGVEVGRAHLWLARPPPCPGPAGGGAAHAGLWAVVCLAALCAMRQSFGRDARAVLRTACRLEDGELPPLPGEPGSAQAVLVAGAVARFWDLLAEFCEVAKVPEDWVDALKSWHGHPFFQLNGERLVLRPRPA